MSAIEQLNLLAESGLGHFPPGGLDNLCSQLWDEGGNTGDARWCYLSRTIGWIAELFDDQGAVPVETVDGFDRAMGDAIPAVIAAETGAEGCAWVRQLQDELRAVV